MTGGKSALIIGATGATGQHVLKQLLAGKEYTRVGEYGRRVTPGIIEGKEKLEQKVIDFENLEDAHLKDGKWDVVFITLGGKRLKEPSAAAWEKIDREYVIKSARAAKTDDPAHDQRVVYLSSVGASASSMFVYTRSKGLTEIGLAELGYKDTIVFRPGFLANANRERTPFLESVFGAVFGLASHVTLSGQINVSLLANAMIKAGRLGSAGLPASALASKVTAGSAQFTLLGNGGASALGNANV